MLTSVSSDPLLTVGNVILRISYSHKTKRVTFSMAGISPRDFKAKNKGEKTKVHSSSIYPSLWSFLEQQIQRDFEILSRRLEQNEGLQLSADLHKKKVAQKARHRLLNPPKANRNSNKYSNTGGGYRPSGDRMKFATRSR